MLRPERPCEGEVTVSRRSVGSVPRLFLIVFVVAVFVVLPGCDRPSDTEQAQSDAEVVKSDAGDVTASGVPMLLDLGSDSCVACKTMEPILDELRETFEGRMDVRFVDVRKDRTAATEYGIKLIPTQIFFDPDGKELYRHQGFYGREDILAKWAELGYDFDETATERTDSNG